MAKKTSSSSRAVSPPAGRPLVIVESPAKAKTIRGFLGSDYQVEASVGHIRDLPASNKEIPAVPKGLKARFGTMTGIDVDRDFEPYYVISSGSKLQVEKLQKLLAGASVLYLATDEDREGGSDRLASPGGSQAHGASASAGVSRDHEAGDRPVA